MKHLFPSAVLLLAASTVLAEPAPSARDILESVRMRQTLQQIDLRGRLRQNEVQVPFQLIQSGPIVRYIFSNPDESLQLQLGEKDSRLDEISRDGVEKVRLAQFDRKIRGTDVTYELSVDLAIPMIGLLKRKAERRLTDTALKDLKKRVEAE